MLKPPFNNHGLTLSNCIVEQLYSFIVMLNLIPVCILLNHIRKIKKKKQDKLCKSKKFFALILILIFDLLIILSTFINLYKFESFGKVVKHNMNFILALLKQIILFLVVFFTFKKASKSDIKKHVWISLVKFMFIIGIVVNVIFDIYINFEVYIKKPENNMTQLNCSNVFWIVISVIELLEVIAFYIFTQQMKL